MHTLDSILMLKSGHSTIYSSFTTPVNDYWESSSNNFLNEETYVSLKAYENNDLNACESNLSV